MRSPALQLILLAVGSLGALIAAAAWRVESNVSPAWLAHLPTAALAFRDAFIAAIAVWAVMLYSDPARVVVAWLLLGYVGLVAADYWARYGIARSNA
ncbi:hypothetical protein [Zhihengliuella salsuginis]|uniref:Uncharacterized protein n=1 Tax=Zhihengliuella salsuginis TaxID=578222 RepID=A0ABQ3GHN0_9MICC|nr:hypothetical protein [Zhihengliuella salsuginis]GHD05211.1 hypothetical protein GCM10008096_13820 [Zhihengliuella salsuginis]